MKKEIVKNKTFPQERALYGVRDLYLEDCAFDGEEDGESALKEASGVIVKNCRMNLRYPLWHNRSALLEGVTMTENCRAALWYDNDVEISGSNLFGIKAVRECKNVRIKGCRIVSPEFGWKSSRLSVEDTFIESEYSFLMSSHIHLKNVRSGGKYSFQYVEGGLLENCELDTKDAFWHSKNVTVKNSLIKGEYLGWYSEGLTLIGCTLIGTQPLCYCKKLRLIDCRTENADLAFEYSDVKADIHGNVISVKNPRSGRITADGFGEIILTQDSKYESKCKISTRGNTVSKIRR